MAAKTTTRKTRKVTPPVPSTRTIRLVREPGGRNVTGMFTITENDVTDTYLFAPLETAIGGVAFRVWKLKGNSIEKTYDVLLHGKCSSCTCPWGEYGAEKKTCRHVAGLAALIANKRLK